MVHMQITEIIFHYNLLLVCFLLYWEREREREKTASMPVRSLPLPCKSLDFNSNHQAWKQPPLLAESFTVIPWQPHVLEFSKGTLETQKGRMGLLMTLQTPLPSPSKGNWSKCPNLQHPFIPTSTTQLLSGPSFIENTKHRSKINEK